MAALIKFASVIYSYFTVRDILGFQVLHFNPIEATVHVNFSCCMDIYRLPCQWEMILFGSQTNLECSSSCIFLLKFFHLLNHLHTLVYKPWSKKACWSTYFQLATPLKSLQVVAIIVAINYRLIIFLILVLVIRISVINFYCLYYMTYATIILLFTISWRWCVLMKPLEGFGVSKVIDSDHPNFKTGDFVSGITGWEEYTLIHRTEQLRKIEPDADIPLSYHVGLLGMILSGLISIVFWDCFSFTRTYIKTYFICSNYFNNESFR